MKMRLPFVLVSTLAVLTLCAETPAPTVPAPAAAGVKVVPIPGGEGGIGFDDLHYSGAMKRVLAPAGRTGAIALVDPSSLEVSLITGFSKTPLGQGHGEGTTSVDEADGTLFATDRTSMELDVVDIGKRQIVSRVKLAASPDYVRVVPTRHEIWVTQPDKDQIEVLASGDGKPPTPKHAAVISVPGGPEALVVDAKRGRAYTHLWKGTTLAIDLASHTIAARWPNGCEGSRGLALDEERGFLFVACSEGKAVTLDVAHDGKVLGTASSGSGVDIVDYDAARGHLYFPGGKSATMAILKVSSDGSLSVLGTVPTAPRSHCVVTDRNGNAFVCDPGKGSLLAIRDPY